jgi:putative transposase
MVDKSSKKLSIRKQCDLLGVDRSRVYYKSAVIPEKDIVMMNFIDEEFTAHPFTGVERMVDTVRQEKGITVNHKRIRRLMRKMGLMAIYPKPKTTKSIIEHAKFPCLIRKMDITEYTPTHCQDRKLNYLR